MTVCPDGVYRTEDDCGSFFQCSGGHQWPDMKCPAKLMFNNETEQCDWPENVVC